MNFEINAIRKALSDVAPAPYDETPAFKKFSLAFSLIALALTAMLMYLLVMIIGDDNGPYIDLILDYFPIGSDRVEFLRHHSAYSVTGYAATVIVGSVSVPIFLIIHIIAYIKFVGISMSCRDVNVGTLYLTVTSKVLLLWLIWMAFIFVPSDFNPRRPGNAVFLFRPFSLYLGSGMVVVAENSIFATIIAVVKFARKWRLK